MSILATLGIWIIVAVLFALAVGKMLRAADRGVERRRRNALKSEAERVRRIQQHNEEMLRRLPEDPYAGLDEMLALTSHDAVLADLQSRLPDIAEQFAPFDLAAVRRVQEKERVLRQRADAEARRQGGPCGHYIYYERERDPLQTSVIVVGEPGSQQMWIDSTGVHAERPH